MRSLNGRLDSVGWRSALPSTAKLRVGLAHWGETRSLSLQIIADVVSRAADLLGEDSIRAQFVDLLDDAADTMPGIDVLVLSNEPPAESALALERRLAALLDRSHLVFVVGDAIRWFACTPWARTLRLAVHWDDTPWVRAQELDVVVSSSIIEIQGKWTTCCGGAAVFDLALAFLRDVRGVSVAARVQDELCLPRVREPDERQPSPLQSQFGHLVPKLSEAVTLMEANIEEPLTTEDIASLVDMSRRQLERLFKKHLNAVPSRYYLELRLNRARRLLREAQYSLLEIGLMCGFSSGSHFSTAYGTVFGITPREERQRMLRQPETPESA